MRINAAGSDFEADKLEELGRFKDDSSSRYIQMNDILLIMAGNWKRFIAGNWKSFFIFSDSISNRRGKGIWGRQSLGMIGLTRRRGRFKKGVTALPSTGPLRFFDWPFRVALQALFTSPTGSI